MRILPFETFKNCIYILQHSGYGRSGWAHCIVGYSRSSMPFLNIHLWRWQSIHPHVSFMFDHKTHTHFCRMDAGHCLWQRYPFLCCFLWFRFMSYRSGLQEPRHTPPPANEEQPPSWWSSSDVCQRWQASCSQISPRDRRAGDLILLQQMKAE